jgi:hypothetical protein
MFLPSAWHPYGWFNKYQSLFFWNSKDSRGLPCICLLTHFQVFQYFVRSDSFTLICNLKDASYILLMLSVIRVTSIILLHPPSLISVMPIWSLVYDCLGILILIYIFYSTCSTHYLPVVFQVKQTHMLFWTWEIKLCAVKRIVKLLSLGLLVNQFGIRWFFMFHVSFICKHVVYNKTFTVGCDLYTYCKLSWDNCVLWLWPGFSHACYKPQETKIEHPSERLSWIHGFNYWHRRGKYLIPNNSFFAKVQSCP